MFIKKLKGTDSNTIRGILAILFWGSTVAYSRSLTEKLGTITAGGLVFTLSGILACIYLLIFSPGSLKKIINLPIKYLWGCGILFIVYMIVLYLAIGLSVSRLQVIEISIINYLWPGLTLLFSIPILRKKVNLLIVPGIIITFIGVYMAMNPYSNFSFFPFLQNIKNNSLPYMFAFLAALSWALYSNIAKKFGSNQKEGAVPIFLLFTGLVLLILRLFFPEEAVWNLKALVELFYMAIFPTFLAYSFWDQAMRHGNIILVVVFSYFTPLISVFISSLYLQINIDIHLWVASILVVIGALISKYSFSET